MDVDYLVVKEMRNIKIGWLYLCAYNRMQNYDVNYLNMAKTCLKVLKVNCYRLESLSLEALACLEVWLLGHDGSIFLSVVTQALLCNFLCVDFFFSLLVMLMMAVSGRCKLLSARFHTGAHRRRRDAEGGLHLLGEVNALDRRVKRFYKHVLSFEAPSASHPCNL
jgi:hypothetical protein